MRKNNPTPELSADGLVTVRSRTGSISATCTATGLPVALRVEPAQLRREPSALAADILALCRLAGVKAGVRRRAELAADGLAEDTLTLLGLPSRDDLLASEELVDAGRRRR